MRSLLIARLALLPFFGLATAQYAGSAAPANELSEKEKAAGWKLLFEGKTTTEWRSFKRDSFPTNGWVVEEGWLHGLGKGGGDIITRAEFEDFEFQWEWKQGPAGNSGVKYFVTETRESPLGHEYQLIEEAGEPDAQKAEGKRVTAAFYDVLKPTSKAAAKPPGEVNQSKIVVQANHVEHWLNGTKVLEYECGSDALRQAIAQSKFKNTPGFGEKIKGHLLLQDHHTQIWFRNLKVRELGKPGQK